MYSSSSSRSSFSGGSSDEQDDVPLLDRIAASRSQVRQRDAVDGSSTAPKKKKRFIAESSDEDSDDDFLDDDVPLAQVKKKRRLSDSELNDDGGEDISDDAPLTSLLPKSKPKKEKMPQKVRDPQAILDNCVFDASLYEVQEVLEPLKCATGAGKWWDLEPLADGVKWNTLRHNGVLFPEPYTPHNVQMLYDGKPVSLTPDQEEVASFYAAMLDTDYVQNPKFRHNFFKDWSSILGKGHTIQDLSKCDFGPIKQHLDEVREKKKADAKLPEVKAAKKAEKERIEDVYGYAMVDNCREKVGNFRVEPPGLFRGRGDHPKTGRLKARLRPENITINIGRGEKIPRCPVEGNWGGVVHNNKVTWLAFWRENINDAFKYIFLHSSSRFKGQSDIDKFEKARQLHNYIDRIRLSYMSNMKSSRAETLVKQRATALWIIDVLALRVGNEKGEDEADTVGCCSLRVEHLEFVPPNRVRFDFLGKDSMRYFNEVPVDQVVYDNLRSFCRGKDAGDQVFDELTTGSLNNYLKELMPGLTAKVFRTYNASYTLEKELENPTIEKDEDRIEIVKASDSVHHKVFYYNRANREVAILCNHQKTVSKTFDAQMEKLESRTAAIINERENLVAKLKDLKKEKLKDMPASQQKKTIVAKQRLADRISRCDERLLKAKMDKKLKSDNKAVALGTSKINYMDPRITVAWCKRLSVPIEKVFNKSLLEKFPWAMEAAMDWKHQPGKV